MPKRGASMRDFAPEGRCLAQIGPQLPLSVPRIVASGLLPTDPPTPWRLQDWIDGVDATMAEEAGLDDLADRLAACLMALRAVPLPSSPPKGARGGALAAQDAAFRTAREAAAATGIDGLARAIAAWERGLAAASQRGRPVRLHGDLVPGNMIVCGGRLTGLIEWSFICVGDPAYDLIPAWFLLAGTSRARFLKALASDADTIARARARIAACWPCPTTATRTTPRWCASPAADWRGCRMAGPETRLPLGQLQLDPPILRPALGRLVRRHGPVFTEPGGGKPRRRDPQFLGHVEHHR
jgi:aminoglycoside phosphotransferase (APT) family kinase protein